MTGQSLLAPVLVLATLIVSACHSPSRVASTAAAPAIVRIDCNSSLSSADELTRSVVAERMREGSYYAALAQIQSLPASVPTVAVLRAEILRRLQSPEARQWYVAMRERCVSADADHGLGLLASQAGDALLAHRYLQEAASARPSEARFRNDLGFSAMLIGNDQQAEFELRTAFELDREDRTPGFNLMLLSLVRGDRASWWRWQQRLAPTEAERLALLTACREMTRQRLASELPAREAQQACPINPLS